MAVTLKDVASVAGVSTATVSRVVNGDSRISEGTRRRVGEALDSLGYRGGSRRVRTMNIGFLIADLTRSLHEDVFYNEVLGGVMGYLEPRGYSSLVSPSTGRLESRAKLPPIVRRVDGVIAGGYNLKLPLIRSLSQGPVPVVFLGRYQRGGGLNAILPDNEEGARQATEHLLGLGRRTIAFVGGPAQSNGSPTETNVFKDRLAGFRRALEEGGHAMDDRFVYSSELTAHGGFEAALELLQEVESSRSTLDAIFAADDWIAIGILRALRRRGYRVPDDVAVVGYNDIPLASIAEPSLTTIHVPKRKLGHAAAKLLLEMIEGGTEEPVQISISPHLVVRESTVPRVLRSAREAEE
jgi:DNA-binding LacI/PurR family transcriptional regulator